MEKSLGTNATIVTRDNYTTTRITISENGLVILTSFSLETLKGVSGKTRRLIWVCTVCIKHRNFYKS